jgi:hypothetical protein
VSFGVVSRRLEKRAAVECLQRATMRPSGLVVEGEAGIGKTTLWLMVLDEARERVPG